ncbi:NADH dehydrogenase [ubiquinone] 1 alpha subcomplex assembly factor 3-like [Sycon ciliatum]|uniref:NADH dehydrogenase [ubiquinone] 1 alpha subcomplex assembly factor 3-like n=1 Tax=Sycon ciliatum TaxID=27933 RepID=UPI0031F673D7
MAGALLRWTSRTFAIRTPRHTRTIATPSNPFLEGSSRTVIETASYDGTHPLVHAYSPVGFTISSRRVFGPVCLLPNCFMQWKVMRKEDITPESLVIYPLLYPKIEVLIIGLGDRVSRLDPSIKERLLAEGIAVDAMDTPNACSTYNYIATEGRKVGAALIPVTKVL